MNMSKIKREKLVKALVPLLFLLPVLVVLILLIAPLLSFGPQPRIHIPHLFIKEEVPMIRRPGTSAIVLAGPPIQDLVFQINPGAAGMTPVKWAQLIAVELVIDVKIEAEVNSEGFLRVISVDDRGRPAAGAYLRQCLNTWKYTPYKRGRIRFWFHGGNRTVTIDASQLQPVPTGEARVVDGTLHYVVGEGFQLRYGAF